MTMLHVYADSSKFDPIFTHEIQSDEEFHELKGLISGQIKNYNLFVVEKDSFAADIILMDVKQVCLKVFETNLPFGLGNSF